LHDAQRLSGRPSPRSGDPLSVSGPVPRNPRGPLPTPRTPPGFPPETPTGARVQAYPSDLPRFRSLIRRLAGNGLIPSTGYDKETGRRKGSRTGGGSRRAPRVASLPMARPACRFRIVGTPRRRARLPPVRDDGPGLGLPVLGMHLSKSPPLAQPWAGPSVVEGATPSTAEERVSTRNLSTHAIARENRASPTNTTKPSV
jgi:hypothetical protein